MKERKQNAMRDMPSAHCLPRGIPLSDPLLYKNIQTDSLLLRLFEGEPRYREAVEMARTG